MTTDRYIIIPGLRGKERPRFNKCTGKIYTPWTTTQFERIVAQCYKAQGGRNYLDRPVMLSVLPYYKIPKSTSRSKREAMQAGIAPPTVKPDVDNIIKIVMDALNGVAYRDDKQVFRTYAEKRYTDGDPYLAIKVTEYPGKG